MCQKTRAAWKRRKGKLTADELVVWDELQALGRSKLAEAFRRQFVSKVLSADSDLAGATQYFAATRSLVQRWARCPRRKHRTLCVPGMVLHRGPEMGSATTLSMCSLHTHKQKHANKPPHAADRFPNRESTTEWVSEKVAREMHGDLLDTPHGYMSQHAQRQRAASCTACHV
jgi:hypothetical protein